MSLDQDWTQTPPASGAVHSRFHDKTALPHCFPYAFQTPARQKVRGAIATQSHTSIERAPGTHRRLRSPTGRDPAWA